MGTIQMTEPTNLDKVLSTKAKFIFITGGVVSVSYNHLTLPIRHLVSISTVTRSQKYKKRTSKMTIMS